MRKWNKLLAMVLAMVMALGLTATAFAAEADGDKKEDTTTATDTKKDEATEPTEGEDKKDEAAEPAEGEDKKDEATEPAEGEDKKDEAAEPTEGEDKKDEAAEPAEGEDKKDEAAEPTEGEDKKDEAAEPAADAYADVDTWAKESVASVVAKGLMDMGETGFAPKAAMTRVDLVTALYRHAGKPSVEGIENNFADTAELTAEQQAAIVWANDKKVVTGRSPKVFDPNGEIKREEIAVILYRYAAPEAVEEDNLAVFTNDVDQVHDWAVAALRWAVANKYVTGISPKSLDPQGTAQRQAVATILDRYIAALDAAAPAEPAEPAEGDAAPADADKADETKPAEDADKKDETTPADDADKKDEATEPADETKPTDADKADADKADDEPKADEPKADSKTEA